MKKTLLMMAAALAATEAAYSAETEIHGITFTQVDNPYQNNTTATSEMLVAGLTYGNRTTLGGVYIAKDGGLKINTGGNLTVTHLYLDKEVVIEGTGVGGGMPNKNKLEWNGSDAGHTVVIQNSSTAWVDVNASYTAINVANMQSGDIYLNANGQLSSGMNSSFSGTIHATLNKSDTPVLVTRTLISGNFSGVNLSAYNFDFGWYKLDTTNSLASLTESADLVTLTSLAGSYAVYGDSEGLKVAYVSIPEPATATLSLLALAGLAARRRRK